MSVTFESNQVSTSKVKTLSEAVRGMSVESTIRVYVFSRLQGKGQKSLDVNVI